MAFAAPGDFPRLIVIMSKIALLFSGQGAQTVGMGRDLHEASPAARALIESADRALGRSLSQVMFDGPEDSLTRTSNCQPALYVHGLACLAWLREQKPDFTFQGAAGLSLGEFTAHAAAGTFDFETGLKALAARGGFMEEACDETAGAMAAMIGGEPDKVRELAAKHEVDVANYNCPGQIVLSGPKAGIEAAVADARAFGVRIGKQLTVAGAYHSRLMQSAQEKLAPVLEAAEMQTPALPVPANFLAEPGADVPAIKESLTRQVTGSVRWEESMRWLIAQGFDTFLELGPGGVLAGMMARIDRGVAMLSAGDLPTLEKALAAL